jgi:hypothetical protein
MARRAGKTKSRPKTAAQGARGKRRLAAVRKPALSRPSRRRAGASLRRDEPVAPLDFERGDERSGRSGDGRPFEEQQMLYPPSRVREAGMTAGETAHPERNTADDLAPDTLLDDEGGMNPADQRGPRAADTSLSIVDASAIGAGGGRDEAEDARVDPISPEEHRRLRHRVARSGTNLLEPNESRAGSPGRGRNRRT